MQESDHAAIQSSASTCAHDNLLLTGVDADPPVRSLLVRKEHRESLFNYE